MNEKICKLLNINVISDLYQRFSIHPAGELGKGAIGVAGLESNGETPRDESRLPSPNGAESQTPRRNPRHPFSSPTGR
jgi:hypothetical protein